MGNRICINGRAFTCSEGGRIVIAGNRITVDGRDVTPDAKNIQIEVQGDIQVLQVDSCQAVRVNGSVGELETQSGDVICGNVSGSVKTVSGSVTCGPVGGRVSTMSGDIRHG